MKVEIKVPAMGESISEATVGTILKASGSSVAMDDELLELETDKVNQVLYAPQAGVVTLNVNTGDVVKMGQVIGFIDSEAAASAPPTPAPQAEAPQTAPPPKPAAPEPTKPAAPASLPQPPAASPTGKGARLTREGYIDELAKGQKEPSVSTAIPAQLPSAKPTERRETRRKMSKIRQVIARRLVEVQHSTAMLTTFNEVDMTQVMALRDKYKDSFLKEHAVKLGFMSFFVKACVMSLQEFPDINAYIDGDDIVYREYYDISIAVSTDRGLVVPVLRNCDQLSFAGVESAIEEYAKKARSGGLVIDDLQGGGFTITNGGVYGSLLSTPILNPPQSGILGMHKIMKRAVVVDDQIVIRPMMYLALSYDHRIVDGKQAVSFLVTLKNFLEDPARLLLEV